jgi:hypothetical protein
MVLFLFKILILWLEKSVTTTPIKRGHEYTKAQRKNN